MFHLNKVLRNYCERTWLLPVKFECFFGKNLKCFVTDCEREHQSKNTVFLLSCQVLILYSFSYKMRPWISKFFPPEIQESKFTTPSNQLQLRWWDYLNYYQNVRISSIKVTKLQFYIFRFIHICWKNPQWKTSFFVPWKISSTCVRQMLCLDMELCSMV